MGMLHRGGGGMRGRLSLACVAQRSSLSVALGAARTTRSRRGRSSDVPLRDQLWMGALKAGSRMRWMDMFSAEEAHVDPAALLIIRTEQDVRAMLPLVS